MRTLRAIFQNGTLKPLDAVDLPDNTTVFIALLENDDLPVDALAEAAQSGGAFDFLSDPKEDIYSAADGEAV